MKLKWLTPARLENLAEQLTLDIDEYLQQPSAAPEEPKGPGWVDPLEANLRSELARKILEKQQIEDAAKAAGQEQRPTVKSDWTEDYLRLRETGWNWRVAAYIAWASSPKRDRWPKSVEELATEVLGLTGPRAIYTWRKRNKSIDEVVSLMQAAPLLEHRRDVITALIMAASDPDHRSNPDRKLLLEMTGDYIPRQRNEEGKADDVIRDLAQMSDEQLDMMMGGEEAHHGPEGMLREGTEDTEEEIGEDGE